MASRRSAASDKDARKAPPPKGRRRGPRSHALPRWLMEPKDLDAIAQRRCLMVLSVLSGEQSVTEVIAEAKISRGFYYLLENRALRAILASMMPGASEDGTQSPEPARRIEALEAKVALLEKQKRRAERLAFLTRQVVKPGPMTTGRGRPPKSSTRSTTDGKNASPRSRRGAKATKTRTGSSPAGSTPTPASAVAS